MMKKTMKFGIAQKCAAVVALFLFCAVFFVRAANAFANSAPMHIDGTPGAGAMVMGDCPFVVEHELLSFSINEFPQTHYSGDDPISDYEARVTARYDFYNPSDSEFTATLAFPFGVFPPYFEETEPLADIYGVTIGGQPAEVTLRHTFTPDRFDIDEDIKRLRNDYAVDEFFMRNMTVTAYEYVFKDIPLRNRDYYAPYAATVFEKSPDRRILMSDYNGGDYGDDKVRVGKFVKSGDTLTVYAIGQPFGVLPEWKVYKNGGSDTVIGGYAELVSSKTISFEALAMGGYDENGSMSRMDYYNAFVDKLNENIRRDVVGTLTAVDAKYEIMRWYTYELTLPAGERTVNEVTAPVYPTIDGAYSPNVYDYEYLLSPAKAWQSFGTLDIEINTPFYMFGDSDFDFARGEKGFILSLDSLPEGELRFSLCSVQNPESVKGVFYPIFHTGKIIFVIILCLIAMLIVGGVIYFAVTAHPKNAKK